MKQPANRTIQAAGRLRRTSEAGVRPRRSWPRPVLALAILLLAVVTLGGVFAVAQAQQADGAISDLTLTSDTPGVLDVAWDAPTGDAPTDYRVNWARSDADWPSWTDESANLQPTTTSQQLTGLVQGAEYKVRVRARYHKGTHAGSPWSGPWDEATHTVAATVSVPVVVQPQQVVVQPQQVVVQPQQVVVQPQQDPGAISGLTLTSDSPGVLDVAWDAPTGDAPTDYRVNWARSDADWPSWTDESANLQPTTTSQQIDGLVQGAEYKVRVRARYHKGTHADSPWSGPWGEATHTVAAEPTAVTRADDEPPIKLTPPVLTVIEPEEPVLTVNKPEEPMLTPSLLTVIKPDGPVLDAPVLTPPVLTVIKLDGPALTPPTLTVIEPDTDDPDDPADPLVALQQSADGSVSEPADGDLPADTTTDGVLIVDGNGVTGRHTDNVRDRNLDSDGNRESSLSPHLYSAEDVDWYAVDLQASAFYQFDVKTGSNLPVFRLKIYDSAGNPAMVTTGTGPDERQVAADNTFGVGEGLRESHSDLLNALPFQPDTAGRYYVSISAPKGGIAPNRVYTLSVRSDDNADGTTTTAVVRVGGSIRTYIMRTETNASSTKTRDFDAIKVALQANTQYRIVWDVACLHEGIIHGINGGGRPWVIRQTISRKTDGTCTDLTIEFTPTDGGDYFITVTARGSDFPLKSDRPLKPPYPFKGVWGTLTVIGR